MINDRGIVAPVNTAIANMRDAGKLLAQTTQNIDDIIKYNNSKSFLDEEGRDSLDKSKKQLNLIHRAYAELLSNLHYLGHVCYSERCRTMEEESPIEGVENLEPV